MAEEQNQEQNTEALAQEKEALAEAQASSRIKDMNPEQLVQFLNEESTKYIDTVYNGELPSHVFTSADNLNDFLLFDLFFGFEFIYRTDEGRAYENQIVRDADRFYEAVYLEFKKRLGINNLFGDEYLLGL